MQAADIGIITGEVVQSITIDAPISTVFAGLSTTSIRSVWAKLPGRDRSYELDFREGGMETRASTFPNIGRDEVLDVRTRFIQILEPSRVVEFVELRLDGVLRTATLVAWQLSEVEQGTRVDYTEQYQVLTPTGDGSADQKERRGATPMMLRGLAIAVANSVAATSD
ncbi:MAG TPA: hypothetical protein VHZ81_06180 [Galbitalea sp.]|jgi:uncharacterized protein YndB with AHSA1/START domain|nr:hypothetical protein [Galbitalea sp.]